MKGKSYLLTGLVFGMAIGWALGFLRLPQVEKNDSFLLGFIAALTFASLVLLLLKVWNNALLPGLLGKKTEAEHSGRMRFVWMVLAGILVLGSFVVGSVVYQRIGSSRVQIQKQEKKLKEMAALVALVKQQHQEPLVRNLLVEVEKDLKRNPGGTLRDTTIARIAALTLFFKPYRSAEGDSLSESAYSPERGQLLQALILMQVDSGSLGRIKRKALFAGADLNGADLKGLDLSGMNLHQANLKNADLSGANLSGADLAEATLWGAKLNRANLSKTDLKGADLGWAQLNGATLTSANLNGANLSNAQLSNADLFDATVQWAQAGGALFNKANLASVDFIGTKLEKVNFSQANLMETDLRKINLNEADLLGARLNHAQVEQDWLDKLKKWRPNGTKELLESYTVVNDTFDKYNIAIFRLKKRAD